ncbi:MAG: DUF4198 domain-containing protein [Steroidobacteraceae bacterium]
MPLRFLERAWVLSAAVLAGICGTPLCHAHDFWLQPDEFWLRPDTMTPMTVQVGHGPFRQRSPIQQSRIVRFAALAPDGTPIDLRSNLHLGGNTADADLKFRAAGAYVLVLETDDRAQSHLPAIRFNDYLKVEGLTTALAQRERTHRMDADGSENYSRRAKSLVQVGLPGAGSQIQVTRPLGLPLEIVPEVSPYLQPRPANLPVRVIYEGRPLAGALLKLTNLAQDATPLETHLTDNAGRATFNMPGSGAWLLNVIWTKALPSSRETDFETVFASLSFGFP